nr:hypothetical protein [Rhizobium sp. ACO-34A]
MPETAPIEFDPLSAAFVKDPYETCARPRNANGLGYFAPLYMWLPSHFQDVQLMSTG